jgi:DNA polymerase III sliding clamp (beta) subunit (PCNA family)
MTNKLLLKAVEKRSNIPALEHILVKNKIGYATDLDVQVSAPVDLVDGLYYHKHFAAGLTNPSTEHKADIFPIFTPQDVTAKVYINEAEFFEALNFVAYGMSKEETRFYLMGVFFDHVNSCMVATDGHRLYKAKLSGLTLPHSFILPAKAVALLLAARPKKAEKRKIFIECIGETRTRIFLHDKIVIEALNIDGKFPEYERVIPKDVEGGNKITLNYAAWVKGFKTAKTASNQKHIPYGNKGFDIGGGEYLKFSGTSVGIPDGVGFNGRYVLDIMNAYGLPEITLVQADNLSPAKFESGNLLTVVMPMRV